MAIRKSEAVWSGSLREGASELAVESGAFRGPYTFKSRFEEGKETNPEELIAAAHAGCFTMAMTALLARQKIAPTEIRTTAAVHLEQGADGFLGDPRQANRAIGFAVLRERELVAAQLGGDQFIERVSTEILTG